MKAITIYQANDGSRFECISFDNGREYQQPYFVNHQDEATIKVN